MKLQKIESIPRAAIQNIIDSFDHYVLWVDSEHHILFANKAVYAQFNFNPDQLIGKYCPLVIHGQNEPFAGCPLEKSIETGTIEEVELFDPQHHRWLRSAVYPTPFKTSTGLSTYLHYVFDITEKKHAQEQLQSTLEKLRKILGGTVQIIHSIVEISDPYTAGHQHRVADLARRIATDMDLSSNDIEGIRLCGLIHDIGKIAVPSEILAKPGRLSENEFSLIKVHPSIGYDVIKTIDFPWPIAEIVHQHHERLDGSGYPRGLKGDKIRIEARILAVADVVEAMTSHRTYRPALGIEKALEEISIKSGILYDAKVVDTCLKLFSEKGYTLIK